MSSAKGVLYVPYHQTLDLLTVDDAFRVCEEVYRMHAAGSVVLATPPSFKLDVAEGFNNHWHVKGAFLKDLPATGIRLYNYYDDGVRNTVGMLSCARYIMLSDPHSGEPLAIVDEHWSYVLRSAASAVVACKWLGPKAPKVLGLVGIGSMGTAALRCLTRMYQFDEIRCTSRRVETRAAFAEKWSRETGVKVVAKENIEDVVRGADIVVGGTTSGEIVSRDDLMREVWHTSFWTSSKTIDVHLGWVRRKLGDDPRRPHLITTLRGKGLRFETAAPAGLARRPEPASA